MQTHSRPLCRSTATSLNPHHTRRRPRRARRTRCAASSDLDPSSVTTTAGPCSQEPVPSISTLPASSSQIPIRQVDDDQESQHAHAAHQQPVPFTRAQPVEEPSLACSIPSLSSKQAAQDPGTEYEMVSETESDEMQVAQHQSGHQEPAHATASVHTQSTHQGPWITPAYTHASMQQSSGITLVARDTLPLGRGQAALSGWQASIQGWVLAAAILFAIRLSRQQTDASRMDVRALQVKQDLG